MRSTDFISSIPTVILFFKNSITIKRVACIKERDCTLLMGAEPR